MKEKLLQVWKRNKFGLAVMTAAWFGFFWRLLFLGKVYFTEDIKFIFYPLEHVYGLFQRAGQLPLWSNVFGFGHPLFSWGQLGFFTPLHLILRQLNLHALTVINISILIHFALGLLGLFIFLRRRGVSQAGSSLAATIFVFSGYNISHLLHLNFFVAIMLMPWLLVTIDVFVKKTRIWSATLLGIVAGVIVLSGQPQIALYCLILSGIVGLFIVEKYSKQAVFGVVLAATLGLTLSSLAWLPLMEFVPFTDRTEGLTTEELYNFSYPPWHAITLIFPTFFGAGDGYWGEKSYQELGAYLGVIPLLLAGVGVIAGSKKFKKERRLAIAMLLIGMTLSLGKYLTLYRALVERGLFPPFTAPGRWLLFFVFGVAVLSALGIDFLIIRWQKKKLRELIIPVGLVVILLSPFFLSEYSTRLKIDGFELLAGAVGLLWFVAAWLFPQEKIKKLWAAGCLGIAIVTIIVFGWRLYPVVDVNVALAPSVFADRISSYKNETGVPARLYSEVVLLRKPGEEKINEDQIKRTDSLSEKFSVHQKFVAEHNDLSCLRLAIESDRSGEDSVHMKLSDTNSGNMIREILVSPPDITDAGYQQFCFDAIKDSAGKQFMISFTVAGAGGNVTLFYQSLKDDNNQMYFVRVQNPTAEQFKKSRKEFELVMNLEYGKKVDLDQTLILRHLNTTTEASSARWIGALSIRRYRDFVKQLFNNDGATIDGDGVHVLTKNRKLFDLAGVTHFTQVLERGATDAMADNNFTLLEEKVVQDMKYRLYLNDQTMPRAFTVSRGIIKEDSQAVFSEMKKPEFDPAETVYLEDYDNSLNSEGWSIDGQYSSEATITNYESTQVDIVIKTSNQIWLVLTDSFTPNWQLYIDDKKAPRFVANQLFRAALVPKGEHMVSWRYESNAIKRALWLTGASLSFILLVTVKTTWQYIRNRYKNNELDQHPLE